MARIARSKKLPVFAAAPAPVELDPPQAIGYMIYVRPKPAKTHMGLIAKSRRTINAELATRTVGQIVKIGGNAWKALTPDMDPQRDPIARELKVGDWIHYRQHAGQKLKIKRAGESEAPGVDEERDEFIVSMADSDVLGKFRDEAHADKFYDWV